MKRSYIREILDAIDEQTISFAGGLPKESLFPSKALQKAAIKALKSKASLQYSNSQGILALREQIAKIYTTKFDMTTSAEQILITTGSQQAFDVIAKQFASKDIWVQNPTYIGALGSFKALKLNIKGFDTLASLDENLNAESMVYMMSDYINPTGEVLSNRKRESVAKILQQHQSYLIEDAAYSLLSFDGTVHKPISALYENSFHVGSFSKIVAPSLRVGWIRSSKANIEKLLISKEALDLHTSTLNQMIINNFLQENDFDAHLRKIQKNYEERMKLMRACLKKYVPSFYFVPPKGGMFIYGSFAQESFSLSQKLLEKKVAIVPGEVFYSNGQKSNEARLNFTNASDFEMIEGIKRMACVIDEKTFQKESIWMNLFSSVFHHPNL